MSETPIERLEMQIAHQGRTIDELSEQLLKQWAEIDRLSKTVAALVGRLVELEDMAAPRPEVTKPPHW
ncbi:SlyX family protein [Consotaella salsifontis]|uniref:Uncharacterized coiled-coil protein SlyX (Sensitive to lysis X) n=1 Tax=Consotaella salsifontis TaxID=1365950 RepID=A0A1T4S1N8_9HYPH|nr:SlyX family protein [Consotaella salsifontis]SKA22153.1 Uncharacterized coiled-coil protein SlyX (sensitive to lysis X) [Consotaella salsifontis]